MSLNLSSLHAAVCFSGRVRGNGCRCYSLVEFPIENCHEQEYQGTDDEKDRESDIADNPGVVAHHHIDIDHEKPHPARDEKDETNKHNEEKHGISPCIIQSIAAKLYKVLGRLSMVFWLGLVWFWLI
jgi:hypothetical protein